MTVIRNPLTQARNPLVIARKTFDFTPRDLPNLLAWYEAKLDKLTECTQPNNTNSDFATWTGVNPDATPTGWSKLPITGVTANHIEANGNACRMVSDGTAVLCYKATAIVGNRYTIDVDVSAVVAGGIKDLYSVLITSATGSFSAELTAPAADLGISRYTGATDVTFSNLVFTNLSKRIWTPTAGSLGGNLAQATAAQQYWYGTLGGRNCVIGADDNADSSLASSNWRPLHDGTGVTIACSFYPTADGIILDTRRTRFAGRPGIQISGGPSGVLVQVDDDTATAVVEIAYSGTVTASAWNYLVFRMSSDDGYSLRVNGVEVASGALLTNPFAGDPYRTLAVMGLAGGTPVDPFEGGIEEIDICGKYLTDSEVLTLETYLS